MDVDEEEPPELLEEPEDPDELDELEDPDELDELEELEELPDEGVITSSPLQAPKANARAAVTISKVWVFIVRKVLVVRVRKYSKCVSTENITSRVPVPGFSQMKIGCSLKLL